MRKIVTCFLLLLCMAAARPTLASDWLRVQDPQSWRSDQGTIEEAVLSVRPKGLYMEYGLYLTFSARGTDFQAGDSLEVQFFFDLPEEAIVYDSWLWVGDQIMQAQIMDQWTASSIYENIVRRRRDPSILFKRGGGQYELRIYPMAGNETRRVKLTYLVPTQWTSQQVTAVLPTNLLQSSRYPLSKLAVLYWPDEAWGTPEIVERAGVDFKWNEDPAFGAYMQAAVPGDALYEALHLGLPAPLQNGVYLNRFEGDTEGLYQLAFMPAMALDVAASRKVAVLVDFDAGNSGHSAREVLDQLRAQLHSQLTPNDAFNLIFSQFNVRRASEQWLPADSATIEQTFAALGQNPLASYSSLPSLLANGLDFIKTHGSSGTLMLVSNSDQVADYEVANQLLKDMQETAHPLPPVWVVDFQDRGGNYQWFGGGYYYGNEYFYTNLTRLSGGNYVNVRAHGSLSEMLARTFQELGGLIHAFDLHTTLENGFCYARFTSGEADDVVSLNGPILQVGKYRGDFPFQIQASGVYQAGAFSRTVTIPPEAVYPADSLNRTIWTGRYIQELEQEPQTNALIAEIIDRSLQERVLSRYTAFLALEPSDTVLACLSCEDETGLVPIEAPEELPEADSLSLEAYPNPFSAQTTIEVKLPGAVRGEAVSVMIYDVLGRLVRRFPVEAAPADQRLQLVWDGTNDAGASVASGVYFCIVTTPEGRRSLKLVYVK